MCNLTAIVCPALFLSNFENVPVLLQPKVRRFLKTFCKRSAWNMFFWSVRNFIACFAMSYFKTIMDRTTIVYHTFKFSKTEKQHVVLSFTRTTVMPKTLISQISCGCVNLNSNRKWQMVTLVVINFSLAPDHLLSSIFYRKKEDGRCCVKSK